MADTYNYIYHVVSLVWFFKLPILGSLFVALTVFEYFYRRYRKKRIDEIKIILLKILQMSQEYCRDDAEHEFLAEKVKMLSDKISENNENIEKQISMSNRVLITKVDAEFEVVNLRLDTYGAKFEDFKQDTKDQINGAMSKIKSLEDDTDFIRAAKKYKLVLAGLISGIIGVNYYDQIAKFIKSLNIF